MHGKAVHAMESGFVANYKEWNDVLADQSQGIVEYLYYSRLTQTADSMHYRLFACIFGTAISFQLEETMTSLDGM